MKGRFRCRDCGELFELEVHDQRTNTDRALSILGTEPQLAIGVESSHGNRKWFFHSPGEVPRRDRHRLHGVCGPLMECPPEDSEASLTDEAAKAWIAQALDRTLDPVIADRIMARVEEVFRLAWRLNCDGCARGLPVTESGTHVERRANGEVRAIQACVARAWGSRG